MRLSKLCSSCNNSDSYIVKLHRLLLFDQRSFTDRLVSRKLTDLFEHGYKIFGKKLLFVIWTFHQITELQIVETGF